MDPGQRGQRWGAPVWDITCCDPAIRHLTLQLQKHSSPLLPVTWNSGIIISGVKSKKRNAFVSPGHSLTSPVEGPTWFTTQVNLIYTTCAPGAMKVKVVPCQARCLLNRQNKAWWVSWGNVSVFLTHTAHYFHKSSQRWQWKQFIKIASDGLRGNNRPDSSCKVEWSPGSHWR